MWHQILRIVISGALIVATSSASTAALEQDVPVVFVGLTAELEDMARWAMDLHDQAGLALPPMRYVSHGEDRSSCKERRGLQRMVGEVAVVEICTEAVSFATEIMVLHETAHAWADHALTPERKDRFQEQRGWQHWRNYRDAEWYENGTEQAAEIIVWGLVDRPIRLATIDYETCDDLEAAYRVLTGRDPLHGYRDRCDTW